MRLIASQSAERLHSLQSTAEKEVMAMTDFEILMIVFTVIGLIIAIKSNRT